MTFAYEVLGDKAALAKANKKFLQVFKDRAEKNKLQTIGTPGGSDRLMTWFSKSLDWGARASRSPKTQDDDRPERVIAIAAVTSDGAA